MQHQVATGAVSVLCPCQPLLLPLLQSKTNLVNGAILLLLHLQPLTCLQALVSQRSGSSGLLLYLPPSIPSSRFSGRSSCLDCGSYPVGTDKTTRHLFYGISACQPIQPPCASRRYYAPKSPTWDPRATDHRTHDTASAYARAQCKWIAIAFFLNHASTPCHPTFTPKHHRRGVVPNRRQQILGCTTPTSGRCPSLAAFSLPRPAPFVFNRQSLRLGTLSTEA